MAKFYKDKLRLCPFILHANILHYAARAELTGHGYANTDPESTVHDKYSKCIGDRCMFYEWNNVRGWCGLATGMTEEKEEI